MSRRPSAALGLALVTAILTATSAAGQNTSVSGFDFSLPGARSRAMGGAFVAIADDATSAYSNPAGLLLLSRPELSIEGRLWSLTSTVPWRGHVFGSPSGYGVDTIAGLEERDFSANIGGLSFLSAVYPTRRWAVGAYMHRMAKYDLRQEWGWPSFDCDATTGLRPDDAPLCEPHALNDGVDRIFPSRQWYKLDITNVGGAVSGRLTETVSVGVAFQYSVFDLISTTEVFSIRGAIDPVDKNTDKKYLAPDFTSPDNVEVASRQDGDDHGYSVNLGVLWDATAEWAFGASFRQGPTFRFEVQTVTGEANLAGPGLGVTNERESMNRFNVPDTYAVGLVYRPSILWRIGFEYDRVLYGQLNKDFREVSSLEGTYEQNIIRERIRLDDGNQLRVGVEYSTLAFASLTLALRGGAWYDSQHSAYFQADDPATGFPAPRWAFNLGSKGEGDMHYSAGFGFATPLHFQVDAAVDLSAPVDTVALSSVWRF